MPILIYLNSPEKQQYKDAEDNSLINFNAALNSAFALYNPIKYDKIKDSRAELFDLAHKEWKNKSVLWDAIIMNPIWINITHIRQKISKDKNGIIKGTI